jgi:DNA-binding MarR family transcriptional regulator
MSNQPTVGYVLKQAQSLLRLRMEEALRPVDLTVSQYSCLFRLRREPGISAAALARSTFVTRQSMNTMLQLLLDRGLVDRPDRAANGRALPAALTPAGTAVLEAAQVLVDAVESRMLSGLTSDEQAGLADSLTKCAVALG